MPAQLQAAQYNYHSLDSDSYTVRDRDRIVTDWYTNTTYYQVSRNDALGSAQTRSPFLFCSLPEKLTPFSLAVFTTSTKIILAPNPYGVHVHDCFIEHCPQPCLAFFSEI